MENWPPPCVQQFSLCSAFSTWRSVRRGSETFSIDSPAFRDQKTPLTEIILGLKSFFSNYLYESDNGKLATTHWNVFQSKKFMKWIFPSGIFFPPFFRWRKLHEKTILKEWARCYAAFLIPANVRCVSSVCPKSEIIYHFRPWFSNPIRLEMTAEKGQTHHFENNTIMIQKI